MPRQRTETSKEYSIPMKRPIAILAAVLSGVALCAAAQTPAPPAKIAVIAFQAAVTQTNEFQRNFGDLQKKFTPKRDQLKTLSTQIDTLKSQLQTQGDTLSETERATRARVIDDKEKQLQRDGEDAQNDFQQEMQDTFSGVASKVGAVLTSYAQAQGFTLVLDGGSQQSPVVLYANASTDITKAIVDAYNVKSGVPPPPAEPGATTPKSDLPSAPRPAPKPPTGAH